MKLAQEPPVNKEGAGSSRSHQARRGSGGHTQPWRASQRTFYSSILAPTLILLTVITILPLIYLTATSFTSWDLSRPGSLQFTGIENYVRIFTRDPRFWNSVRVQFWITLLTVPAQIVAGLGLALFLKEKFKHSWFVEVLRGVFIVPMVIPPVVAGLIWKILFTPPVSILSYVSTQLGFGDMAWLGDPTMALVAISIASVWEFFPFCFLLLYAGLLSLPEEPIEAAYVDGASYWQSFWHVVLPMLSPTLSIVLLFRIVDSIRTFPLVYIMTDGGPGFATEPTNYYAFQQAFSFSYIGYSSAIIVVILAFTMLLTYAILRNIRWSRQD